MKWLSALVAALNAISAFFARRNEKARVDDAVDAAKLRGLREADHVIDQANAARERMRDDLAREPDRLREPDRYKRPD